jgi:hypothetical protein
MSVMECWAELELSASSGRWEVTGMERWIRCLPGNQLTDSRQRFHGAQDRHGNSRQTVSGGAAFRES